MKKTDICNDFYNMDGIKKLFNNFFIADTPMKKIKKTIFLVRTEKEDKDLYRVTNNFFIEVK